MPIFPLGRTRVDVSPADVGRRLSLRYRSEGLLQESEAVGVMTRWTGGLTDGTLRVRRRNSTELGIRVRDIVAMRVVPPEASAYAMMRLAEESWPPMAAEDLGPWRMRASKGATSRANSVRVGGPPPQNMSATLAKVSRWYAAHGLPPRLQLSIPSGMDTELDDLGWTDSRGSRLMNAPLRLVLEMTAESQFRSDLQIEMSDRADAQWLGLIAEHNEATAPEYQRAYDTGHNPGAFVSCRDSGGQLLGIGHCVLLGSWCCATTIRTSPQARREGIATAVTGRLAAWAAAAGARNWFLQFYEDNAAALSFYERLGFRTHHRYEYRSPVESDTGSDAAL
jgi:ribosomal protein S18 acetylase RimI-like enzyme